MFGSAQQPLGISVGGIMPIMSLRAMDEVTRRATAAIQNSPVIISLASHVRHCGSQARQAKEDSVEKRMFQSVRARRGEYDPEVLNRIRSQGGSEIYMMITSNKCRGAGSWLRDVMLGSGMDKPWTLRPTPLPSLPPEAVQEIRQKATREVQMAMLVTGGTLDPSDVRKLLMELRDEAYQNLMDEAKFRVRNMERKMEDQMAEGGATTALDQFIDDITTFPAAVIKGPVVRRRPKMQWAPAMQPGQQELVVSDELVLEWERVDPFMVYPSPASSGINDGFFIERHKLRQADLEALIGVEGYDEGAIREVLELYGRGGLSEWLSVDATKAEAEGRSTTGVAQNPDALIDALQFWGTVSGLHLRDYGLSEEEVPDTAKQYHCEVWLIGSYVIKASLNYHPLGEKPYYKASYEDIPGSFWGNGVADLVRDCQQVCNSAARALTNNMGIASGPQVSVLTDRLPAGEDVTQMFPWKIWQFKSDPFGSNSVGNGPVQFFQPQSNAQELMAIYEKFSVLADEYSGIPRYMTGDAPAGGAGRTASGMSMLMNNANKSMKQVVSNIDNNVITPLLNRLYFYNMKYSEDMELKGDVQVIANGAGGVLQKESTQVRRNEFLAATANPFDLQIMGTEGRAALLRERARDLDMDPTDIIPSPEKLKLAQRAMQAAQQPQQGAPQPNPTQNGQMLQDGSPITETFAPTS